MHLTHLKCSKNKYVLEIILQIKSLADKKERKPMPSTLKHFNTWMTEKKKKKFSFKYAFYGLIIMIMV